MKPLYYTITLLLFTYMNLNAQVQSYQVIDKSTNEPLPYATVQFSENKGIITNEEGIFSYDPSTVMAINDSIYISSLGYEKVGILLSDFKEGMIYIAPKAIELSGVYVSNKNLSAEEIIDLVEDNLENNYAEDYLSRTLFFRQSDYNNLKKMNVDFEKSTIAELNEKFIDSVVSIIPRNSSYFTEVLGTFSGNAEKQKFDIIKGAELYDKSNDGSMEALSEKLEAILKKNVKPDSYLKIKSGWFLGTKVQMDSIFDNNDEAAEVKDELKKPEKNEFLNYRKSLVQRLLKSSLINEDATLNVIHKSGRYEFKLKGNTAIDDQVVYVIDFEPKRGEDFKGTLYINTEDYAIIRVDYQNVKNLKSVKLFGFSFQDTDYKGKTVFAKRPDGKYALKFMEKIRGNSYGVKRPLKIIEKNKNVKGRRKQNELSVELDIGASALSKFEVVVFETHAITEADFNSQKENKSIKPEYMSKYNPDFWQGHNIIEPNTAIKEFTVMENGW